MISCCETLLPFSAFVVIKGDSAMIFFSVFLTQRTFLSCLYICSYRVDVTIIFFTVAAVVLWVVAVAVVPAVVFTAVDTVVVVVVGVVVKVVIFIFAVVQVNLRLEKVGRDFDNFWKKSRNYLLPSQSKTSTRSVETQAAKNHSMKIPDLGLVPQQINL